MGAQDHTEKVLRDIHVLFSKAQPYNGSAKDIIVDKNQAMELLKELNGCMYDMMEEHELTTQSRDKAQRQVKKQGDDIIFDASRKAEDIYAASVLYTDNALNRIQSIMEDAQREAARIYKEMQEQLKEEKHTVRTNQMELKSQLQDLIDTQKYLRLIEEENRRQQTEKEMSPSSPGKSSPSLYADIKPEIKINKEYFKRAGLSFEEEPGEESQEDSASEQELLDDEYFRWKEEQEGAGGQEAKKEKVFPFFGKK